LKEESQTEEEVLGQEASDESAKSSAFPISILIAIGGIILVSGIGYWVFRKRRI